VLPQTKLGNWFHGRALRTVRNAGCSSLSVRRLTVLAIICFALGLTTGAPPVRGEEPAALRIVVMDPLCAQLACECVEGYAQRDYARLAEFLRQRLKRPVRVAYAENVPDGLRQLAGPADLVVGKESVVVFDAVKAKLKVRPVARLTGPDGTTTVRGLFVVRADDPAKRLRDLDASQIVFGPSCAAEKHEAALAELKAQGLPIPKQKITREGCSVAAAMVVEGEARAAVISSYAKPLLEGCGVVDKGALRVVGKTEPVPFVTVFATARVSRDEKAEILAALLAVREKTSLLKGLETKQGFVRIGEEEPEGWTDWRGPDRAAITEDMPERLPAKPRVLWRRELTGPALSGISATTKHVLVADKDKLAQHDILRCLDAATGKQVWEIQYRAEGEMDYSNAPRATPVIRDGLVFFLGAFGDLACVTLDRGRRVWTKNMIKEFGAERVTWGTCSTPLLIDDRLIVNPGAKDASLVALELLTGKTIWKGPGEAAGYSSFIVGKFGGVRQIVGYDAVSLGGWDPQTGKRLWRLVPEVDGDFNVGTPVNVGGKLLVSTENNGSRLYGFGQNGTIIPKPLARNEELAPDSSTPVFLDGLVFGCWGKLFCLDANDGLKKLWGAEDPAYEDYTMLMGGNGRVLIASNEGQVLLVEARRDQYVLTSRARLFRDTEVWSHPAIVGNRLYVRDLHEIVCVLLDTK